jgi:phosphomannomutase
MAKPILLFDMDGTLTTPRKPITVEIQQLLLSLKDRYDLGVVSGSDFTKVKEQLGDSLFDNFEYVFLENGVIAYQHGKLIASGSITGHLGADIVQAFVDYCLNYISQLHIPKKTGRFVELRHGLINVSPIGRDCSPRERDDFEKYDLTHKVREKMIKNIRNHFKNLDLVYSVGGQISFDVFPRGWDKSYCLRYLKDRTIHFFGDKTEPGGNDYEIYNDIRVIGHAVGSFHDTIVIVNGIRTKPY